MVDAIVKNQNFMIHKSHENNMFYASFKANNCS